MLFSIVTAPIYRLTNSVQVFSFFHILANTLISYLFDDGHSKKRQMTSHCGFGFHFPDD